MPFSIKHDITSEKESAAMARGLDEAGILPKGFKPGVVVHTFGGSENTLKFFDGPQENINTLGEVLKGQPQGFTLRKDAEGKVTATKLDGKPLPLGDQATPDVLSGVFDTIAKGIKDGALRPATPQEIRRHQQKGPPIPL